MRKRKLQDSPNLAQGLAPLVGWGEVRLAPLVWWVEVHLVPLAGWGEVCPGNRRRKKVEQINARLSRCGKTTVRSPYKCVTKSKFMQRLYAGTATHPGCCNNLFIT